jgi:hypothetical protein
MTTWRITSIEVEKRGGGIKLHCYNMMSQLVNTLDCLNEDDAQIQINELEQAQGSKISIT